MIEPKNLLIVRTDRIGDVVLSLPLAKIIKKHFPECKITFLVRKYTKSLVENHPYIDNVIILKQKDGKIPVGDNIKILSYYGFDSCIVVYPTYVISLITYLSHIKNRIGTGYRWYSFLFNQKVYTHRKYAEKHELEFNVDLLQKFGIEEKIDYNNIDFDLYIDKKSETKVNEILKNNKIVKNKPVIIIHPGSGGSAIDLPIHKFDELIKMISAKFDVQMILTGSEDEKELCEELNSGEKVTNFSGELNLSELIAVINKSDIFISNSTGPIHIAAALGKYTIGFYPKILACSAKRWGPYSEKSAVFKPNIDCKNCTREQCEKLDCMSSINLNDVLVKIENIYKLILNNGEIND